MDKKTLTMHTYIQNFFLFILLIGMSVVFSCGVSTEGQNFANDKDAMKALIDSQKAVAIDIPSNDIATTNNIREVLLDLHKRLMVYLGTASSDVLFISDPFFAVNYIGTGGQGYEVFYNLSIKEGLASKMYVIQEPIGSNGNAHNIDIGLLFQQYPKILSKSDYLQIKFAKRVIVSPLLKVLSPLQYRAIAEIRRNDNNVLETIAYSEPIYDESTITVNYSQAMHALGMQAAEEAIARNNDEPTIVLELDIKNTGVVLSRVDNFLKGAFQVDPHINIMYNWGYFEVNKEGAMLEDFSVLPADAVIYIDAGELSYTGLSQYILNNLDNTELWIDRFFMATYLWSEDLGFNLPVNARVEIPRNFLFKKNDNIQAVLSRKLNKK